MIKCLNRLLCDETGTVAIEYALIASIVSIVAIGSMIAMGSSVTSFLYNAQAGFTR